MAEESAFPVVGIGASAGGIQALESLFRTMPADTGIGFVIVTHLMRGRESLLPEIMARYTAMPVLAATQDAVVEPNHVYLGGADSILTIKGGRLALQARPADSQPTQIDVFLSSLAEDRGEAAIGILLSGSGHDGTLGFKAIQEHGGLTLAQGHNGSAPLHGEMPNSAIAAGAADLVVTVEDMAARIVAYGHGARRDRGGAGEGDAGPDNTPAYRAIHAILHQQVGHDFSGYKQRTFQRRVRRRMQVLQSPSLEAYVARLRDNAGEVANLFRDLLIGVTGFFRDPDAFDALAREVIPSIFEGRSASDTVRVWIPACATGEEVYSIVIQLLEQNIEDFRVVASDINPKVLHKMNQGLFHEGHLEHVSKYLLHKYYLLHL